MSYVQGWSAVSMRLPTSQHPLENKVKSSQELRPTCNFLQTHLQEQDFFGSQVTVFSRDLSHWSIGSYVPFLQGSQMQKQYRKRTTLRSKSSTIKGLLYTPDPEKREKEMLSDQPQLSHVTSMALLCHWGHSRSKIWHPLGLTLRCMPYGRGTLRNPLQRIL